MSTEHNKPVQIALICDDNYIIPTCTAIQSIVESKQDRTVYCFNIVCASLGEESEQLFRKFASDTVLISIIREDANRFSSLHIKEEKAMCVATPAALLKFTLPELLPKLDRVLYLDGDILVREDLSALYETELSNCFVAAVPDSGSIYSHRPITKKVHKYFNSGVMLLNLKQMRLEKTSRLLVRTKKKLNDNNLMDQDVFNLVFDGHVVYLPIWYNFLGVNLYRAKDQWSIEIINNLYQLQLTSIDELFDSWVIMHFASKDKPWKNPTVVYARNWQETYKRSPAFCNDCFSIMKPSALGITQKVIVSLTSFPARINTVDQVIITLCEQTIRADKIILWLAEEQFPDGLNSLPEKLLSTQNDRVEIRWCPDIKPHKKYYYTMLENPESIVITVDDDINYPPDLIEKLLKSYLRFPFAVSTMRARLISFDQNGTFAPYTEWKNTKIIGVPSYAFLAIGAAGILYPPHCMNCELFNIDAIKKLCLYADDLWLKVMQVLNGTPVVLADEPLCFDYILNTQEKALWKSNVNEGENNKQLLLILKEYNAFTDENDTVTQRMLISYNSIINGSLKSYDKNIERTLAEVRSSRSYRIGRAITWFPRKVRGAIRCYKKHGLRYTLRRVRDHLTGKVRKK